MIYSMTAFAQCHRVYEGVTLRWEIRSLNQRFLELSFSLPEEFSILEPQCRERLRQQFSRGKIDCRLRRQSDNQTSASLTLNANRAEQLLSLDQQLLEKYPKRFEQLRTIDILRWPDVIVAETTDSTALHENAMSLFAETLDELKASRAREGHALEKTLLRCVEQMRIHAQKIDSNYPKNLTAYQERLQQRLAAARVEVDDNRLAQEMVILAQKTDIREELDRLLVHLKALEELCAQGGVIGRRADFLLQELNREANTLGAKAIDTETASGAIELKVLIEQMREQIQNIE